MILDENKGLMMKGSVALPISPEVVGTSNIVPKKVQGYVQRVMLLLSLTTAVAGCQVESNKSGIYNNNNNNNFRTSDLEQMVSNPNTSSETLAEIAAGRVDHSIIAAVAGHPNVSQDTLLEIFDNYHALIRTAFNNPNITREFVDMLAFHPNIIVRIEVSTRPDISAEALAELANDSNIMVRTNVALHFNTNDPDEDVRRQARGRLYRFSGIDQRKKDF